MSKFFTHLVIFGVTAVIAFAIMNNPEPLLRDNREAENVSEGTVIEEVAITETKDETQKVTKREAAPNFESDPSETIKNSEGASQEVAGVSSEEVAEEEVEAVSLTASECQARIDENSFYWESEMQAVKIERELRESNNSEDADLLRAISCTPQAVWIFGDNKDLAIEKLQSAIVKSISDGKILVLVIYNAPQHSSLNWGSGVGNGDAYLAWITSITETIGVSDTWVILEPDAIPLSHNLTPQSRAVRLGEIRGAVEILKERAPNAAIYLDAGHNAWKIPERISEYLITAGIEETDGFSLNVSNYQLTSDEIKYGKEISGLTGGKHFIIDTSRNGKGPAGPYDWCNALSRAIGEIPTVETNEPLVDAFLWVKPPGESDGFCNGGPTPGKFWLDYALDLIKEAA